MGGDTTISQPATPVQPSTADAIREWVTSMPQVYQTQMEYAPLQAEQQVQLAQQYAQPLGEAMLAAQRAMYPETTALQEQLAGQASEGMQSDVPDWMRQEYLNNVRAQLGEQAGSRIGGDYVSLGLMQQKQDWQNYYRNLGLSVAGRQPLAQPGTTQTTDYMSNYTPSSVMGYTANNYGNYSNAYSSMYGSNAYMAANNPNSFANVMGGIGGAMQGLGAIGTGGGFSALF